VVDLALPELAMRTFLWIVAGLLICGCAGTRDGQNPGGRSHTAPVVLEPPSISARLRYERQQQAEQTAAADTEVQGALKR
jgi:hypothetical protein